MTFPRRKFRARRAWTLLAFFAGLLPQGLLCAQNSPLTTAPIRLRLEKTAQSDWPAKVGVVDIAPCWSAPSRFGLFDADGKPVAFQAIWSAPGEATRICFDTSSGGETYYVCFDTTLPTAAGSWRPEAGVLVETRPCRTDLPINTAAQIATLIGAAGPVSGRDFFPNIFLGANPFGPSTNYIATFSGWFQVPKAAQYTFATDSVDASWLEVDNKNVATWFGVHNAAAGRHGEQNGTIQLSAGTHHLSYVQIQLAGAAAAVAAWKPPGSDHVELISASAFGPVARFHPTRYEWASSGVERLYFDWRTLNHCALGDAMVVEVQFRAVDNSQRRSYRWHFDDGAGDTGPNPRHFFPQPGLRQVSVEALQNGVVVATNSIRVRINPEWEQREWWRENVFTQAKSDFLRRDLAPMPARDLLAVWELADRADDPELLRRLGETLVKRQNEFNGPASAPIFYKAGLVFEHQGDSGDALAEKSFRLALAAQSVAPAVGLQAKLRMAALLIHCSGQLDEAGKLLNAVSGGALDADDRRLCRVLQGDLSLALGKNDEARKQYAAVAETKPGGQPKLARAARLESAAILIEHSQWDDAQAALDRLELETPLERMSLDAGLLGLTLDLGRKEFQRAFTDGQTLLAVAGDDPRQSEVLFTVVQTGLALGRQEEAQRALGRLLKDFPYSEAAAKAKDKWINK
jgi:tetratricopeptide (TPR) repeat protein